MSNNKIEISKDKQYKTVEGGEVVLYEFFEGFWYGRWQIGTSGWMACRWHKDGKCEYALHRSLVEIKPELKRCRPFDDIEFKKQYNNEWCCMKTSMNSSILPVFKIVYADSEGVSFIYRGVFTILTYKEAFDELYLLSEGTKPGIFGMEIEE